MKQERIEELIGPRVTRQEIAAGRLQFLLPTLFLGTAGLLLIVSIFLPYWRMELRADTLPEPLQVQTYLHQIDGDVAAIDALNQELGMRPLAEAAELERSLSVAVVVVIALLVVAAVYIHNQYAALLSLPAVLFPAIFLLDLYSWLRHFGTTVEPESAIEPFAPPLLGAAEVGPFTTIASTGPGLLLAILASLSVIFGLWLHRRAYRPLIEARRAL